MAKKIFSRKTLAFVLALVMCFSTLQLTSLAAAAFDNQVMDGYYVLNADNSVNTTTETAIREQDGFKVSKTIEQTGVNQFDITLKVVTSQEVTTSDAAIQLVIDTSISIQDCSVNCGKSRCNHDNRLEAVKNILTKDGGFLDSLTASNSGKIYVSVVTFGQTAKTVCDWTDIKASGGLVNVKNRINGLNNLEYATNMHAGLVLARNRLGMSAVANTAAKFTVLLSDGAANCVGSDTSSTTEIKLSGRAPSGSNGTEAARQAAQDLAQTLKGMSSVYAVGYGVEKDYLNSIIKNESNVFVGTGATDVSSAFADIAESAVNGMNGAGSTVNDPMGEFIILGDTSDLSGDGVTANRDTLTWKLDPANAETSTSGNVTTYTYTITYPITLDTSAKGFKETNDDGSVKYYPANGYTYLSAVVDGKTVNVPFNVPGVCGEIPEYNWRIEYYLEDEEGTYTLNGTKYALEESKDMGAADLWSSVSAPEGYKNKYSSRHYEFASGNPTIPITAGENVIKLYYNRDLAKVTVNHFYKTTVIKADGTVVEGTYPAEPQTTSSESKWIGTSFSAQPQNTFGGAAYELDEVKPNAEITVSADEAKNVINFYYTREDDQRAITSAEVKHIYKTYGYELQAGRYVLVEKASATVSAQPGTNLRATTIYAVTATSPLTGYEGFTLNTNEGDYNALQQNDMTFVLAENPEDNVRTLVFEKTVDNRGELVTITVNHYYKKTTVSVQDGQVITTVDPDNELVTETFTGYADEAFAAAEINVYESEVYVSDPGNAAKCAATTSFTQDQVIDLYYTKYVAPETVSITVNHYWRTFTDVTVEKIDPETNEVIGTEVVPQVSVDHKVENLTESGLYEGQNFTAALQTKEGGYVFNVEESNRTITVVDGAVINLYYDRSATDDVREEASIDVLHKYITHLTTIVDGQVDTITVNDGTVPENYPVDGAVMKAGDTFTAVAQPTYNEASYTQTTDDSALTVILQSGTNSTIVIEYVREASDLVPVTYDVNYVYKTYTMTVNDEGKAGYWNEPAVDTTGSVAGAEGFVGQQVTLSAGEREGFAPLADNPATVQILESEGNTWTFVYEKYIPLDLGSVTVNHHYKTITIAENGTATEATEDVFGTAEQMYLGESFLAASQPGTFTLVSATVDGSEAVAAIADNDTAAQGVTVVISGDNVVDFYYEKTVDNSRLVDYTISHIYNLYTYNGQLISSQKADDITGSGFVTTQVTAVPTPAGYELVSVSYNDAALDAPYTISLADGKNEIVFVYEQYQPREEVDVTVIHNYYEGSVSGEAVEVYKENISGISEDSVYTAQLREKDDFIFHSANPNNMEITAVKGGENKIVVNYIRIVVEEPPVEEPPVIEIPEEEVPLAPAPEVEDEIVDIPDEDVPLASVPKTGDATILYATLTTLSGIGLAALGLKKKEKSEE